MPEHDITREQSRTITEQIRAAFTITETRKAPETVRDA